MFNFRQKDEPHQLDDAIETAISEMTGLSVDTEEYGRAATALKTLIETRAADKKASKRETVSPDVLVSALAHLTGIVAILSFEKANVITSKSLSFVPKIRP